MKKLKQVGLQVLLSFLLIIAAGKEVSATTYTVTSTGDAGAGTLRQAITDANTNIGLDTIRFLILITGNTFETSGGGTYAVIQVSTALPVITDPVLIDGSTQTDLNTGSMNGRIVGVDSLLQASIPYPDVWIVPSSSFSFPSANTTYIGNGLTVNASGVTIRNLCISGFGNTNTASSITSHHADVALVRSATVRSANFLIQNCFLSCDPRGGQPALISGSSRRRTKSGSLVVGGNNNDGIVRNNYMAYAGTYHIHFNGNFDHMGVGPSNTTLPSRNWLVEENILLFNGTNANVSSGKAADAVNMMRCKRFRILENYIEDSEQVGIDMGYNTDSNYVANNTITGLVNTTAAPPLVGIRAGLGSMTDTIYKNTIYNNTGSTFKGGVWIDRSFVTGNTVVTQDNSYHHIAENLIFGNSASGVVISENVATATVAAQYNTISRNRIYNNTGLGIDLGFPTSSSPVSSTAVSVNDDGDGDAGTNDYQNFPIIDSAKLNSNFLFVWGKAPTGSLIEFFIKDNQMNNHGGRSLSYGEGKSFIGSGVEGSAQDLASGLASYNIDGNVATNNVSRFYFSVPFTSFVPTDSITATATLNRNTSEFGPKAINLIILDCHLLHFSGNRSGNQNALEWNAICDKNFGYFQVEYSADGQTFNLLNTVRPAVADSGSFHLTHTTTAGKLYYRLKMVSADGSHRYSQVLPLGQKTAAGELVVRSQQNPFQNQLQLSVEASQAGDAAIAIVNAGGTVVTKRFIQLEAGHNQVIFDELSNRPNGLYRVIITSQNKTASIAVVKE